MCCRSPSSVSGRFWRKPGKDDFVVWFGFHEVIVRGTRKWHISAFLQQREERYVWNMAGQKGFSLWAHWGEFALCCHSGAFERVVRRERNSSCALRPQPAPEPRAGNSGLCACTFWLSEKPEVECFYSCVPSVCTLLSGPSLPGNKMLLFCFLGFFFVCLKTTSISEYTACQCK